MTIEKYRKWQRWFTAIHKQFIQVLAERQLFMGVRKMVLANEDIQHPGFFHSFFSNIYHDSVFMAIRRQVKIDKDSISIARLLNEISESPEVVSRDQFIGNCGGAPEENLNEIFNDFCDQSGNDIDVDAVSEDLNRLRTLARKCEGYADRRIAHHDARAPKELPTYEEIDNCLDFINELVVKYHPLFRGGHLLSCDPMITPVWLKVFWHPWIKEPGSLPGE